MNDLESFQNTLAQIGATLGTTEEIAQDSNETLGQLNKTIEESGRAVRKFDGAFSSSIKSAIDGVIVQGESFSDVMRGMALSMSHSIYNRAIEPVTDKLGAHLGGAVGEMLAFANGGAFSQGRVVPFAKGGIVTGPTNFPMRGGTGLMGEAGPEAIMPLTRTADGRLGVAAQGGGRAVHVTMNITTPDVQGFQRSQSQIAAQMSRALGQAQRNR